MEDLVHEPLEYLCSIPESKRHLHEFKQTEWSCDSCFSDVRREDCDLVACMH